MERIVVKIPVSPTLHVPGDTCDVLVDGAKANVDSIPLWPEVPSHPGHLAGPYGVDPHLAHVATPGHLQDLHLIGEHLIPGKVITVRTWPLYYGLHSVEVRTSDYLGNLSAGPHASASVFLRTGPIPPRNLTFASQTGAGPVTFSFTPSPQLAA